MLKKSHRRILLIILIFAAVFQFYRAQITANSILFDTDEMYWIQTANIVPLLMSHAYRDTFWDEYYGFINFNTAKFVYGIGLPMLGSRDFSQIGVPPETYYRWEKYAGIPFPKTEQLYTTVQNARIISAFFAAAAVCVLFPAAYAATASVSLSLTATLLTAAHPITRYIATHALADSIFMFFEMTTLLLISRLIMQLEKKESVSFYLSAATGVSLALLAGTKINGLIFVPFAAAAFIYTGIIINTSTPSDHRPAFIYGILKNSLCIAVSFIAGFVLLHPNFFFYPSVTPVSMIRGRELITRQHIAFFSETDPSHVLLHFTDRVHSSLIHLFPVWLTSATFLAVTAALLLHRTGTKRKKSLLHVVIVAGVPFIWLCVISYTVFDEQRYFLPVLPLLILALMVLIAPVLTYFRRNRSAHHGITGDLP